MTLSATDKRHADTIAAWHVALACNSNGGCGVSLRNNRPPSVLRPDVAKRYAEAVEALGWHYTRLPFPIARRMSSIPSVEAWTRKREAAGNPPLMDEERAAALLAYVRERSSAYENETRRDCGPHVSARVLALYARGIPA